MLHTLVRTVRRSIGGLVATVLVAHTAFATQQTLPTETAVTTIVGTRPANGDTGVPQDRVTAVRFSAPIDGTTLTPQSFDVSSGGVPIAYNVSLDLSGRVALLTYPGELPPASLIDVVVRGGQIDSRVGGKVDGDGDGRWGGQYAFSFNTGWNIPVTTDTATVIGRVFGSNGAPLAGAEIDAVYYPPADGDPPLTAPALSDANGNFQYETVPFSGTEEFLVRIRKPGFSESLRRVELLAGRCWRVENAFLQATQPRVMVTAATGGTLSDDSGLVTLEIPPGALQFNSAIGITVLQNSMFLRDELPRNVVRTYTTDPLYDDIGMFVDVAGVFGEETNVPVLMRIPIEYAIPDGTPFPLGKVDHNTLEWVDMRDAGEVTNPAFVGEVVTINGQKFVEIEFDHFCSVCTSYCLPEQGGGASCDDNGGGGGGGGNPGGPDCPPGSSNGRGVGSGGGGRCGFGGDDNCGGAGFSGNSSSISEREGFLYEVIELPGFIERGAPVGLQLGYASHSAAPSATLSFTVEYPTTRPIERTLATIDVEGLTATGIYGYSAGEDPVVNFIWDGRNGLGQQMSTGTYPFQGSSKCLHADAAVSLPAIFGETANVTFSNLEYPGLSILDNDSVDIRIVLVNKIESPYGAGWSVLQEHRLHVDPDGFIVITGGNSDWRRFEPDPAVPYAWISPQGDYSRLTQNPNNGRFLRTYVDGAVDRFEPDGRLASRTDRYGSVTSYGYNAAQDRLTSVTTPSGFSWMLSYDGFGDLDAIVDSSGRVTDVTVDGSGDLVQIVDAEGTARDFLYDAEHRLVEQSSETGSRSTYEYHLGRVVATESFDTDGTTLLRRREFAPSAIQGELNEQLALGIGDDLLNPIPVVETRQDHIVDGRGFAQVSETDVFGRLIASTDAQGRTIAYEYTNGALTRMIEPDGSGHSYSYDADGQVTAVRQLNTNGGVVWTTSMENNGPFGQVSRIVDPDNRETLFAYDGMARLSRVTEHDGTFTEFEYADIAHPMLATRVTGPSGELVDFTYDSHGNVVSITDYTDLLQQPQSARVTTIVHDGVGRSASVMAAGEMPTGFTYDDLNRLASVTDGAGNITSFGYDSQGCSCTGGELTSVSLPGGSALQYEYDGLGRMTRRIDQLGIPTNFTYDAEGNQTLISDRNGQSTTIDYSPGGDIVRRILHGGEEQIFEYDPTGNLVHAFDALCDVELIRDVAGRVTTERSRLRIPLPGGTTVDRQFEVRSNYFSSGDRYRVTDSEGWLTENYAFDGLHRVTSVSASGYTSWSMGYDDSGRRTRVTRNGPGFDSLWSYDDAGQLVSIQHQSTQPVSLGITGRSSAGDILQLQYGLPGLTASMTTVLDDARRLVRASHGQLFGDARTNLTGTVDAADRLQGDAVRNYTYDGEGRLTARVQASDGRTDLFTYDSVGQLRRHREESSTGQLYSETEYTLDPLGRRVARMTNGVLEFLVQDGDRLRHVVDARGRPALSFIHGDGPDDVLAAIDHVNDEVVERLTDHLSTQIAAVRDDGTVIDQRLYGEDGQLLWSDGMSPFAVLGFTGRPHDMESGLFDLRARMYDPDSARFMTEDPLEITGGFNVYQYAAGNPLNLVDPFGLAPNRCCQQREFRRCMNSPDMRHLRRGQRSLSWLVRGIGCVGAGRLGAAIGSLIPGLGTAAGAAIGCIVGAILPSTAGVVTDEGIPFIMRLQCRRTARINCIGG